MKLDNQDFGLAEVIKKAAYELNSSLAIALGQVQLLKLKNKESSATEGLNRLEKSLYKCAGVIETIQEYSGQTVVATRAITNLSEVLKHTLESEKTSWKDAASQKNLTLVSVIESDQCTVRAEEMDLVQAVSHLVHKAVKASPRNCSIDIRVGLTDELATLSIADCGKGISKEKTMYDPSFKKQYTKGAEPGMTTVRSIMSRFGGRLEFAPNSPKGTIVTISIPQIQDRLRNDYWKSRKERGTDKRILIVDDDAEVRNVLCDMLMIEGFRAETSPDAYSALELLEKGNYSLMITDLGMPGMSGLDLAEHAREKYKSLEIVLLTGWYNSLEKQGRKLPRVKAVISKPFRLNQILDLVRT